ncbi:MAG: endolytic transglycosylase MltG [Bacteroidales bacterium]|nr:endolytic transglycosylase MltG [Bacteroidales bacterium]
MPIAEQPTTAITSFEPAAEPPVTEPPAPGPTDAEPPAETGTALAETAQTETGSAAANTAEPANIESTKIEPVKTEQSPATPAKPANAKRPAAAKAKPVPRPSRQARHPLVVAGNVLLTLTVVVGLALMAALSYGEALLRKPGPLGAEKIVNLSRVSGFRDIGDLLEREGVVENGWVFVGGVLLRQARQELKAGEYLFPRAASVDDVIGIIASGKSVLHQVTVPEGLTSEQTVARLLENDVLTGPIREIPKEGSLLPETYRFSRGITREQILQRMAADQRRVVAEIWAKRAPDLPLRSPEDLVTLASIIEKETGKAGERPRVAAVFINRLNRRMKLQSDPTIIYGLVGGKGALGRPILRADIDRPTAYNTYVIDALPPGPIANPGRASLEAAANPADTKDLFFVADGTGGHAFAETLEEHNRNVARWREIERQQGGQAAPPSALRPAPALRQRN